MWIAGIDPSINGTACTLMNLNDDFSISSVHNVAYDKRTSMQSDDGDKRRSINLEISTDRIKICKLSPEYASLPYYIKPDYVYLCMMQYGLSIDSNFSLRYAGVETYGFGSGKSSNNLTRVAEFVGGLKYKLYSSGTEVRDLNISTVKMYATNNGNADKMVMCAYYARATASDKLIADPIIDGLPSGVSPKADIVDSFYMADLLRCRLFLESCSDPTILSKSKMFYGSTEIINGRVSGKSGNGKRRGNKKSAANIE